MRLEGGERGKSEIRGGREGEEEEEVRLGGRGGRGPECVAMCALSYPCQGRSGSASGGGDILGRLRRERGPGLHLAMPPLLHASHWRRGEGGRTRQLSTNSHQPR